MDTTIPDTYLDSQPANPTNSLVAAFAFSASKAGCTFACKLDSATYAPCASPIAPAVAPGSHTFAVLATDATGNADDMAATYTWTVDVTPPDTSIVTHPANPTNSGTAAFTYASTKSPSTFTCQVDAQPAASCPPTGASYTVAAGAHSFAVYATDQAGNRDSSAATFVWTVDQTAPVVTFHGAERHDRRRGDVTFTVSEPTSSLSCDVDGLNAAPCTGVGASYPFTGLATGAHTAHVTAIDLAGNKTIAPQMWTVDARRHRRWRSPHRRARPARAGRSRTPATARPPA